MRKRPAQAITYDQRHKTGSAGRSRPPFPHEKTTDRLFTALARITGLTRHARARIVHQLEQVSLQPRGHDRLQQLHAMLNTVVDGGWAGLWTSVRVTVGAV